MKNNKDIRDSFLETIYRLARKDKDLVFISDDMDAFVLSKLKKEMPNQYINIGVAEQNMMDVAAGLAVMGKKVYVFGICSYITMRAFEQIKFSICSMSLPVTIVGIGAGFSFPFDGPTHHGINDIALMRIIPEIEIYNPSTAKSAEFAAMDSYKSKKPNYVRLDKGIFSEYYNQNDDFNKGYKIIKSVSDTTIISTGYMTHKALDIVSSLKIKGKKIGIVDVFKLKPFNHQIVDEVIKNTKELITIEENSEIGGLGSMVLEVIKKYNINVKFQKIALKDRQDFFYGSREYLIKKNEIFDSKYFT